MTNPTPHGQVPAIRRYKICYHADEWGVRSLSPIGIYDDAGPWVRYEDHVTALKAAQPVVTPQPGGAYAALPESLILAVDRWFSANTGLGGCSDKDVRELAELFYAVTHAGGRESVDDALAIVESFGPGISGINDTYARQILLAEEVKRLRASHGQAPAPQQSGVGNGGFDHKTAADFLAGKTVSDEAMRKFVTASRWAHDDRAGLQAKLLSVRNELASREAEIALLKTELMDAEEALKIIGRQAPCPHDNTDSSIGDGSTWARCYDCGVTFEKANAQRAIDAATEFERAIEKLRHLIL